MRFTPSGEFLAQANVPYQATSSGENDISANPDVPSEGAIVPTNVSDNDTNTQPVTLAFIRLAGEMVAPFRFA